MRPTTTAPLSVSSTTGAPNVAATYSPADAPSAGMVTYSRLAVLMISADSAAIPAPQPKAKARLPRGSGSSRSIHSTVTTSSGTGSRASGSAMANGAAPRPAANDCAASIARATIAQAAVTAMPTMNPAGVRPGVRSASTARGSNGSPAAGGRVDSLMGGSLLRAGAGSPRLRRCSAGTGPAPDWFRPVTSVV